MNWKRVVKMSWNLYGIGEDAVPTLFVGRRPMGSVVKNTTLGRFVISLELPFYKLRSDQVLHHTERKAMDMMETLVLEWLRGMHDWKGQLSKEVDYSGVRD